jgi:glycosyltransferase involved in cell wall biosynthesis
MAIKKHKMLVICPHPENIAPGQRLKYEQYFEYFRANSIEVTVRPFMSNRFQNIVYKKGRFLEKVGWTLRGYWLRFIQLFTLRRYDVVYVFLWVTPFGPPFFEWLFCKLAKKIIYDIDDLVFLPGIKSDVNPVISSLKGRSKPFFMMKHADHVITCTPYLDSIVRKYNQRTTDISSTINTDKYRPKMDYHINNEKVVLGWSGSVSTIKHLRVLEPVFKQLQEGGLPFRLLVMGDENFRLDGIDVEALAWKESYEVEVIKRFDIGLYPLPDEQWVFGKSGLKALQYMAAGVPTIATAIGTNFRIIKDGYNGFLVKNNEEWIACLKKLINDEQLRRTIGQTGAEEVEKKFSINANRDIYLNIIRSVVES